MQEMGCDVVACITILDRQEGGAEAFEKAGIQLLPILLRSDITGE
jgi:orotate phosphoribosyltransferase